MPIEKEYYQYLNQIKTDCETACPQDKTWAMAMFDKAASPYHYWKEAQLLQTEKGPIVTIYLTDGESKTIDVKEGIKKEGFKWDKEKICWSKTLSEKNWDILSKTVPFNKLHIEIKKEP